MANIIRVEHLIFDYQKMDEDGNTVHYRALNDVSFEIEEGSFVAIVGHNGSGKSTLAKNLNGLLVPTAGDIFVCDMNTKDDNLIWDIRSNIGMVFQNPDNQIVSSVVEDDVAFGPENLGVEPKEIRTRVDNALKEVGMYEHRKKGPHQLSGGQKQRIAIAGVVAMHPKCIVFDEPTAMLDPKGRAQAMEIIHRLHDEGITTILITHFMEEAAQADRIIVMKDGSVYSDSSAEALFMNREKVLGAGLEMPPVVDLRERLVRHGYDLSPAILTEDALIDAIEQIGSR